MVPSADGTEKFIEAVGLDMENTLRFKIPSKKLKRTVRLTCRLRRIDVRCARFDQHRKVSRVPSLLGQPQFSSASKTFGATARVHSSPPFPRIAFFIAVCASR